MDASSMWGPASPVKLKLGLFGNIEMSQPRSVKRIAPQTMYVGRSPLVPIGWGGRHPPDGELPAASYLISAARQYFLLARTI